MSDEFFTVEKEDYSISVRCVTCDCEIPITNHVYTFPICKDCIAILKEMIAERKNHVNVKHTGEKCTECFLKV